MRVDEVHRAHLRWHPEKWCEESCGVREGCPVLPLWLLTPKSFKVVLPNLTASFLNTTSSTIRQIVESGQSFINDFIHRKASKHWSKLIHSSTQNLIYFTCMYTCVRLEESCLADSSPHRLITTAPPIIYYSSKTNRSGLFTFYRSVRKGRREEEGFNQAKSLWLVIYDNSPRHQNVLSFSLSFIRDIKMVSLSLFLLLAF